MGGGYDNLFSQYQALPTNLQNYIGGQAGAALMNRGAGGGLGAMAGAKAPGAPQGGMGAMLQAMNKPAPPQAMPPQAMPPQAMPPPAMPPPAMPPPAMPPPAMPPQMGMPQMGGLNTNPFMAQSQYAAPTGPLTGTDYNAMAQQLSGVPEGGQPDPKNLQKFKNKVKKLKAKLKKEKNSGKSNAGAISNSNPGPTGEGPGNGHGGVKGGDGPHGHD